MDYDTKQLFDTDFTKVIHREPYPTVSTSRPELKQTGKSVLITGGATGVGFAIARSFLKAEASNIIIIGRREAVLEAARTELIELSTSLNLKTNIIIRQCDHTDRTAVRGLWAEIQNLGIFVDVLVLNAASFSKQEPILKLGADEVWSAFEANVYGPLLMVDGFNKQPGNKPKVSRSGYILIRFQLTMLLL